MIDWIAVKVSLFIGGVGGLLGLAAILPAAVASPWTAQNIAVILSVPSLLFSVLFRIAYSRFAVVKKSK